MRSPRRLLILLGMFVLAVLTQRIFLPPMEGGDEYLHLNYVEWLVRYNTLPDRQTSQTNSVQQQSGQPPLVYWTASLLVRLFNLPVLDGDMLLQRYENLKNPWFSPPDPWRPNDNHNLHFYGIGAQSFVTSEVEQTDNLIRWVALGFSLIAIIGTYGAAREVFVQESWALVATAVFTFTPQMVHLGTFINTDIGSIALAALITWQSLRLIRCGAAPARLVLIGGLLGLGGLAKINTLLVAPAVGIAMLIATCNQRQPWTQLLKNGLLVAIPLGLVFGPWVIYGAIQYQDPLGLNTHLRPGYYFERVLTLVEVLPLLPEVYLGYWGKLGSAIYLHPVTYTLLSTLPLLGLAGYGSWLVSQRRIKRQQTQQFLVLTAILLVSAAGLLHWLQTIHFITGRLMYPAHTAVAIAVTGGIRLFVRRWPWLERSIQAYTVGVIVVSGLLLTPLSLYTAYAPPPRLTTDKLPVLSGSPVDFENTIRFLGYTQSTSVLSREHHTMTLCWQVLQATERPAAFSVKIVHDGQIIADRTSVHGLGRYPSGLWQPGDIFCDEVDIPITTPPQTGQTYDVLLVLLDARTQAVDWQAKTLGGTLVPYPFIAQVTGG